VLPARRRKISKEIHLLHFFFLKQPTVKQLPARPVCTTDPVLIIPPVPFETGFWPHSFILASLLVPLVPTGSSQLFCFKVISIKLLYIYFTIDHTLFSPVSLTLCCPEHMNTWSTNGPLLAEADPNLIIRKANTELCKAKLLANIKD
jgi:hypothetical protein